jgi:hypothetical protein
MTTAESESSASKKEYYDQDYFDSDEDNDNDESSMSVDKPADKGWFKNLGPNCSFKSCNLETFSDRQKKREVIDNDELLYNPEEDDTNEDWVAEQLRGNDRFSVPQFDVSAIANHTLDRPSHSAFRKRQKIETLNSQD